MFHRLVPVRAIGLYPPPRYSLTVNLWVTVALSLGLPLLLALPAPVWAAAAQIKSITPACAAVGQTTTLSGTGFGATNLQIMVGAVPAALTSATGNHASFVVPAGVAPGVAIVTATNPGNQSGSIALRVKGPEICGANTVDEDCDGHINEAEDCPPLNAPPSADAGPDQTHPVGTTVQLDGTRSSDPDGDALTFAWSLATAPSGSGATLTDATTATPTFVIDKAGAYTVHLTVSDGRLSSTVAIVIVSTTNSAPVAQAGEPLSGQVGTTLTLDGSGSTDVDGDSLTYQWSLLSGPSGSTAALGDATSVHPTFTIDTVGDYLVQLIVHDGTVPSAPDTVTISTLNSAPVAEAGVDQSAPVGTLVRLDGSHSSDVDGNSLSYQWGFTTIPAGSTATLSDPHDAQPTFTIDKPGLYVAQLVVNDGLASSEVDTVQVSTVNSKPVADAGADQTAEVGHAVQLDGRLSSDVDGDALTYQWALSTRPEGSAVLLTNETTAQPSFTPDRAGSYVGQLIVHDGTVASEPDTALVTVTVPPDTTPPAPADLGKIIVSDPVNGQSTITGAVASVEGGATVTMTNSRTGHLTTVTANADGSFTATVPAQAGDTFSIVVTDAAGNVSTAVTTVVGGGSVGGPPPQLAITFPVQGTLLSANRTRVTGTVQGPVNTGVVVNGIVALVSNGTFVADNVPLTAGQNTLTAVATALGTESTLAQVAVTSDGDPLVLEVSASPTSGIAPLDVTFSYQFGSSTPVQQLRVDFDGNGSFDFITADPTALLQHTYTTPGLYMAHLQVTTQGQSYDANIAVIVQDTATMDALFKSLWNGMNVALMAGDKAAALTFLDSAAQTKYGPVFDVLLPHMTEIVASYSPIRAAAISSRIAEYGLNRTINSEKRLFLIYFLKDNDGVWRLAAL